MMHNRFSQDHAADESRSGPRVLTRKQVQEAIRRRTSLAAADIRGLDLRGFNFDGMDLSGAKLAESNLAGCSFRDSNLSGASLWSANLQDAILDGATLDEADFDFARLDGVSVKGARARKAIWPDGRTIIDTVHSAIRTGQRLRVSDPGTTH